MKNKVDSSTSPRRPAMQDSGFSFIELLVSVTIMAVMMAAAVVSYSNTNQRSRDARRQADVQTIRSALEICRSNTGIYPASIAGTVTCSDATVTLSATPTDPQTGNAYPYSRPTTTTYSLSCTLELAGSCSYTQP